MAELVHSVSRENSVEPKPEGFDGTQVREENLLPISRVQIRESINAGGSAVLRAARRS